VSGYGEEVEATMSDSDDDDDDDNGSLTQWSKASPRSVRRAESLEGPYSLLSLPLPSDGPDSGKRGSDRDTPGKSHPAVSGRSPRSLDQRLDELFAKGPLGLSPPSSLSDQSDQQSDVEESDSLSEEELDIIKLRKPFTVTLQAGGSEITHSTTPVQKSSDQKSSDQKSEGQKSDQVAQVAEDDAPLTDDMVDQIVRMKPMLAKAARHPLQVTSNSCPEDLSLKTDDNLPVDLSSKPCSSETSSNSRSTTCTSLSISTTSCTSTTTSLPASTSQSHIRHHPEKSHCLPGTAAESRPLLVSGNVQVLTEIVDKPTESTSTLISATTILPVPSTSSVQQCASPSGASSSVNIKSTDGAFYCRNRALDQHVGQLASDSLITITSRYRCLLISCWFNVTVCRCIYNRGM